MDWGWGWLQTGLTVTQISITTTQYNKDKLPVGARHIRKQTNLIDTETIKICIKTEETNTHTKDEQKVCNIEKLQFFNRRRRHYI